MKSPAQQHNNLKILLTGSQGQLGQSIQAILDVKYTYQLIISDLHNLNIVDESAVNDWFRRFKPDICINAAAYTAVDLAEDQPLLAMEVNAKGPANLAKACAAHGTVLIHISTDYVYHSTRDGYLKESDETEPMSSYGRSKLEGERHIRKLHASHIILRTSWLYSEYGHNFVKTMLRLARQNKPIHVVDDQVGAPTYAGDLAEAILSIIDFLDKNEFRFEKGPMLDKFNPFFGIYNFANAGATSWYGFARKIFEYADVHPICLPVTTAEFPVKAPRPNNSRLDLEKIRKTFDLAIPNWETSLERCLKNLNPA